MIAAKVTALSEALRAQDAPDRAASTRPTSQPDNAFPDDQEAEQGGSLRHSPPYDKDLLCFMVPDTSHDERTGRFTHSENVVRAGGGQAHVDGDEEAVGEEG